MNGFRPNFPQLKDDGNGSFTNTLNNNNPTLIFFVCPAAVNNGVSGLYSLVEKLLAKYGRRVRFFWVDSGEDKNLCQRVSLNGIPTVILFHQSKEVARFSCVSSEPGICYNIDGILDPNKNSGLRYIRRMIPIV